MSQSPLPSHLLDKSEFTVFEARPGVGVVLLPDPPKYTLVAVSNDFVRASGMTRDQVIGKGHFEVFPRSPDDPNFTGEQNLKDSFAYILQHKVPHEIPVQRYDIPNGDGTFSYKYWQISNAPVLSESGAVRFIVHTAVDITDKVQSGELKAAHQKLQTAYTQLHESEAKYRSLFESIDQGFCVLEMIFNTDHHPVDYRFLEMNPAFEEQTGLRNAAGKTASELVPNLEQHWFELYGNVATSGEPIRFVEKSEAMGRWFDVFAYRLEGGESRKVGLLFRNITDRKKTEEALIQSEQQIRALIASTPFPIGVYVGREMRIQYANQAMIEAFGKGDGIIGKLYREALPELDQIFYQRLDDVFTTGQPFHTQNEPIYIRVDGTLQLFYYSYSCIPLFDATGGVYGVMVTAINVTELNVAKQQVEQSSNKLRNMILQAPVAMCIFRGKDHVVEIANDSMLQIWGKSREQVIGRPTFEANPEGRNQGFEEILENIYRTGQPFRVDEIPLTLIRQGKEELFYTNLSYDPIKEADGSVSGILVVGIEVTQQVLARRKIEEVVAERTRELAAANEELRRSNKNLEEFAYAASHDMKEPIRKIHFFTDRLKERLLHKLGDEDQRYFERLERGAKRMTTLIDDLLLYSNVNRGVSYLETVDLNRMLSFVLDDLELHIEEKGARIEIGPLPTVEGHPRQLQQLFINLIANSLKYSKQGVPPEVHVTARLIRGDEASIHAPAIRRDKAYHLIEVRDNGIGFEQADAERIFTVFTRLHGNTEYRGSGVGLSIAQKIAEYHEGHIWAESAPGKGATFSVLLPAG